MLCPGCIQVVSIYNYLWMIDAVDKWNNQIITIKIRVLNHILVVD